MWSSSAAGGVAYAVLPSKSAGNANAAIFVLNMIYSSSCCASEAEDHHSGAPLFTGLAPATTAGVRANLEARCFCAMSRSSGASNSCFTPCYPREFAPKRTRAQPDEPAEPSLALASRFCGNDDLFCTDKSGSAPARRCPNSEWTYRLWKSNPSLGYLTQFSSLYWRRQRRFEGSVIMLQRRLVASEYNVVLRAGVKPALDAVGHRKILLFDSGHR